MTDLSEVKLIAVDMDGTFLRDNKTFDRARFSQQLQVLHNRGIRFVVASGNQYHRLVTYFEGIDGGRMAYVAENGGHVRDEGQALFVASVPGHVMSRVYQFLKCHAVMAIICGEKSAYALEASNSVEGEPARIYYDKLEIVERYQDIEDNIIKVALRTTPEASEALFDLAHQSLGDELVPVTSGFTWIDLMMPGVHKAAGLQHLQNKWQIPNGAIATFGDNDNDLEMLQKARFSFAMENGSEKCHQVARYKAGLNNDSAVLDIIDDILEATK